MAYADLDNVFDPAVGDAVPVAWLEQIRENFEYLIDPPRASVTGDATTCSDGTWTTLDADTELFDTDGIHTGTSDALVIVTPGTYEVGLRVQWDVPDTNPSARSIAIYKNSATRYPLQQSSAPGTALAVAPIQSGVTYKSLIAGDSLVAQGKSDGENADGLVVELWVRWIGR